MCSMSQMVYYGISLITGMLDLEVINRLMTCMFINQGSYYTENLIPVFGNIKSI